MSVLYERGTAKDEPINCGSSTNWPILTPAAILARAADVIEGNGLARGTYCRRQPGPRAQIAPVCTLGAIAIATGLEPYVWDGADLWRREHAAAAVAIEVLLDFLGLGTGGTPTETVGSWNDSQSAAVVVGVLRVAAREAAHHERITMGVANSM